MRPLLLFIFLVSVLFTALHIIALKYALYWVLPWFDILMHFMGGFLVALIAVGLLRYARKDISQENISGERILIFVLSMALLVGIAWEIFEYIMNLRDPVNYVIDTATDIIMDLIGANAVYWIFVHSRLRSMIQ